MKNIRVAFTGPESSGKTTLSTYFQELAGGVLVEEYARTYLQNTKGKYDFEDLEKIAKKQFEKMEKAISNLVWIDTDLIVMEIWSKVKFEKCCDFILENVKKQEIDLYVLCKPDFKWEYDSLRENPYNREKLYDLYLEKLQEYEFPYIIASGRLTDRILQIQHALESDFGLKF